MIVEIGGGPWYISDVLRDTPLWHRKNRKTVNETETEDTVKLVEQEDLAGRQTRRTRP